MYSLFRRSTLIKKGFQSTEIKHEIILNSYEEMEKKPSLLEGDHEDMSNKLYSFHNGMVYLKQVECPSRRHAVAPDGEIPNSVVRRTKVVEEVIEEKPQDKLMSGVWKIDRPMDVDAAQLGESLISVIDSNILTASLDEIKAMSEELSMADREKADDKAEMFPNLALPGWQNSKLQKLCQKLFADSAFKLTPDADWNAVFDRLVAMLDTKEFPVFSTACKYLVELNNCRAVSEEYRKDVGIKLYSRLKPWEDPNIKIAALKAIGAMDLRREQDYGLIKENIGSDDIDVATAALELKKLFKIPDDVKEEPKPKVEVTVRQKLPRKQLSGEAGRLQRMSRGVESRMQKTKVKAEGIPGTQPDQKPVAGTATEVDSAKSKDRKTAGEDKETTKGIQKPGKKEVKIAMEKGKEKDHKGKKFEKERKVLIETTEQEDKEEKKAEILSINEEILAEEESRKLMVAEIESLLQKTEYEGLTEEEEARLAELEAKNMEIEMALKLAKEKRKRLVAQIPSLVEEEFESLTQEEFESLTKEDFENLTQEEFESLTKEEAEELMRERAEMMTGKDVEQLLAMKDDQLLAAQETFEKLSAEQLEGLEYVEDVQISARDAEWKKALASTQFSQGLESDIYDEDDVSFHHPTDMVRKTLSHSKFTVPIKMYKIHKALRRKAQQRGEAPPEEPEKKVVKREKPRQPSIPDYEPKKIPGYLVSDAFKKPDKSREKFFKRSFLSSRAAPTPTQRLVAHLDEPSKSHRKCFELESAQNLPTILSAHEVETPVVGESVLPVPQPTDQPVYILVEEYQPSDVPGEALEAMQETAEEPVSEEWQSKDETEPGAAPQISEGPFGEEEIDEEELVPPIGEKKKTKGKLKKVSVEKDKMAAAPVEQREREEEEVGEIEREEKEMVVDDKKVPRKKDKVAVKEEGKKREEKEMEEGVKKVPRKKDKIAAKEEGKKGEEKEMEEGVKKVPRKKDKVVVAAKEGEEEKEAEGEEEEEEEGEEEEGEDKEMEEGVKKVPRKKDEVVASIEGEKGEGEEEREEERKEEGEDKEMVLGVKKGEKERGEEEREEEGKDKEMVVGVKKGEKEGKKEREEEGKDKEMAMGAKKVHVKKDKVAVVPVEKEEAEKEGKIEKEEREMVEGIEKEDHAEKGKGRKGEKGKRKKVAATPKPEIPSTSGEWKPIQSSSAPDMLEGRVPVASEEPTTTKGKVESVPSMKERDAQSLQALSGEIQGITVQGAAQQMPRKTHRKEKTKSKEKEEEEMESMMPSERRVSGKGSVDLEPLEEIAELLSESEMELRKLIKTKGSRKEVKLTIEKNRKMIYDLMTKQKKREAALTDSKWVKESERIISASEERAMACERYRLSIEHKENPIFESMEPSISALANIRLATLSDKPPEEHEEFKPSFPMKKPYETTMRRVPGSMMAPLLKEKFLPISEDKNYSDKEWQQLIAEKQEQLLRKQLDLEWRKEMREMGRKGDQMKEISSEEESEEEGLSLEELAEGLMLEPGAEFTRKDKVSKKLDREQQIKRKTKKKTSSEEYSMKSQTPEKLVASSDADMVDQSVSSIKAVVPSSISPYLLDYQQFSRAQHELKHKKAMERLKYIDDVQLAPMGDELYRVTWEKSLGSVKEPKDSIKLPRIKYLVKASPKRSFTSVRRESFTLYGKELYPPICDEAILNPQRETQLLIEREKIFSKKIKKPLSETMKKYKGVCEEPIQEKHPTEIVEHIGYTKCLPVIKDSGKVIDSKSAPKAEIKQPQKIPGGPQYYNLFMSEKFNAYRRQSDYLAQKSQIKSFKKYSRPEWYPEDQKLMYSPNYYQQLEKTPEDHRRPHSTIY